MFAVDSQAIDREATIPGDVVQYLKDFGMFGLEVPLEYGMCCFTKLLLLHWEHIACLILASQIHRKGDATRAVIILRPFSQDSLNELLPAGGLV